MTDINIPYLQETEMGSWSVDEKCHFFTFTGNWGGDV